MYQNKNQKIITQAMVEGERLTWLGRFVEKIIRRLINLIMF